MSTPAPVLVPPRSRRVTVAAWLVMVPALLMLPISACSALMVAAGSYGTAHADAIGYAIVVFGPLLALVCGFGLLRRRRWGWYGVLALLGLVLASSLYDVATAPTESTTTIGPDGVRHTTLAGGNFYAAPMALASATLIVLLLTPRARRDFAPPS